MNIKQIQNKTLRSLGGQMLKGRFFSALVFVICCEIMARSVGYLIAVLAPESDILAVMSDMYYLIIQGPICFAKAIFFLWMFRGRSVGFNSLVHGFEYFRKDLQLFMSIFVRCMVLSFLFVIPGIICYVRYSQAFYILADDPSKTPKQCMNESLAMMRGLGLRFVSFILSFAGWFILSLVPQIAVCVYLMPSSVYAADYETYIKAVYEVVDSPLLIICQVFTLMVTVYVSSGTACFYDIASGKLVLKTDTCEENGQ